MSRTTVTVSTEIEIDIKTGATWFASLSDEDQSQFFVQVFEATKNWPKGAWNHTQQWFLVGRHIAECECSSDGAREVLEALWEGYQSKREKAA